MLGPGQTQRLWMALLACLLLGCGESERATGTQAPPPTSTDAVDGVTLEDAGTEPRVALRYAVSSGIAEAVTMALTMRMTLAGAKGVPTEVALPVVDLGLTARTERRDGAGLSYVFAVDSVAVRDDQGFDIAARLAAALEGLEGLTHGGVIDAQGLSPNIAEVTDSSNIFASPDFQASVHAALGHLLVTFPKEAVGVGATWHRTQTVQRFGVPVRQRVRYVLARSDAAGATVMFSVTQSAPPQPMPLRDGAVAQLTRLSGEGSGTAHIAFDQLAPRSLDATVATSIEAKMGAAAAGVPLAVTLKMTLKVETTP